MQTESRLTCWHKHQKDRLVAKRIITCSIHSTGVCLRFDRHCSPVDTHARATMPSATPSKCSMNSSLPAMCVVAYLGPRECCILPIARKRQSQPSQQRKTSSRCAARGDIANAMHTAVKTQTGSTLCTQKWRKAGSQTPHYSLHTHHPCNTTPWHTASSLTL